MWEDKAGEKMFHGRWFGRGSDTVLGETCDDPTELVVLEECEDCLLSAIVRCREMPQYPPWNGRVPCCRPPPTPWDHVAVILVTV